MATVEVRIEREVLLCDQWLFYQNLIFKCLKVLCHVTQHKAEGEGKTDRQKGGRRMKERFGGSSGDPRGPGPLTYPVRLVKQVSRYFGRRKVAKAQPLTVAGLKYKSPPKRIDANLIDTCYTVILSTSDERERVAQGDAHSTSLIYRETLNC